MLSHRLATEEDLPALTALMTLAIEALQRGFLTKEEIEASHDVMGLDRQLVADRTYFVIERDGVLAGCGGWSRRATLYCGDHSRDLRDPALLDPRTHPARIRAMYTHPDHVRQGVGRMIIGLCEQAAAAEGFRCVELMATLAGEPLYRSCGFTELERVIARGDSGVMLPLIRMGKTLRTEPKPL